MDTLLYDLSIPAISSMQSSLMQHSNFMQLMSVVFDPKYAFLIYSPIAYLLDAKVGQKLVMTTVLAEWLNQILKWFLHGERPYWYVHSSGHFDAQQVPIRQFPITCELGPGHPSGHAMVTAAVWYIILDSLLQAYKSHQQSEQTIKTLEQPKQQQSIESQASKHKHYATLATWFAYVLLLTLVSVSRVFLGCHFPHQCVAGAALGLFVARWVSSKHLEPIYYVLVSAFLFLTAFGTFGLLQLLGLEPNWTIKLATTHCVKRDYIHLDTAPFFSVMRYCGFALGCGLGLLYPLRSRLAGQLGEQVCLALGEQPKETETAAAAVASKLSAPAPPQIEATLLQDKDDPKSLLSSRNVSWLSAKLVTALVMARLVDSLGLFVSHSNLPLFYSSAFCAYTAFSYAFISL